MQVVISLAIAVSFAGAGAIVLASLIAFIKAD